jgi:hypothetical protein
MRPKPQFGQEGFWWCKKTLGITTSITNAKEREKIQKSKLLCLQRKSIEDQEKCLTSQIQKTGSLNLLIIKLHLVVESTITNK